MLYSLTHVLDWEYLSGHRHHYLGNMMFGEPHVKIIRKVVTN